MARADERDIHSGTVGPILGWVRLGSIGTARCACMTIIRGSFLRCRGLTVVFLPTGKHRHNSRQQRARSRSIESD